jgi:hypothetical protein
LTQPLTCREQILVAFTTQVAAIGGMTVARERVDAIGTDELDFLAVYDDGVTPQTDFSGERDYTLVITVEGYIAGDDAADGRVKADAVGAAVESALYIEPTLGGLARDLRPNPEPTPPRLDAEVPAAVGCFIKSFEVDFATSETDPRVFA